MAQNLFQPILGETKTPTYISPGVVDTSTAQLVGNLGNMVPGAIKAYENYQTSKIMPEIDQAIDTYEEGYHARQVAGAQELKLNQMWDEAAVSADDTLGEKIDYTTKAYEQNMSRIVNAKKQGLLTENELLGRINQITREAVMQNPWLEKEIYNKAQGYLQMSGISDVLGARMKSASDEADAARKQYDFYRNFAKENGILPYPNEPIESLISRLEPVLRNKAMAEQTDAFIKGQANMDKIKALDILKSGQAHEYHNAYFNQFRGDMLRELKENQTPQGYAAVLAKYKDKAQQVKMGLRAGFQTAIGNDVIGKEFVDQVGVDYDTLIKDLESFASGKDALSYLDNLEKTVEARQKLQVRDQFNVYALQTMSSLVAGLGPGFASFVWGQGKGTVEELLRAGLSLGDQGNAGDKTMIDSTIKSPSGTQLFDMLLQKSEPTPQDVQFSSKAIATFNSTFQRKPTGFDEFQGMQRANELLTSVAKASTGFGQAMVSTPQFSQEVSKTVDYVMGNTLPDLDRVLTQTLQRHPTLDVEFDVLPSGVFTINTNDSETTRKLNDKFSTQINTALDAYAKSSGKTREQVGEEFFQKYFQQYAPIAPESPTTQGKGMSGPQTYPDAKQAPVEPQSALQPNSVTPAPIEPTTAEPQEYSFANSSQVLRYLKDNPVDMNDPDEAAIVEEGAAKFRKMTRKEQKEGGATAILRERAERLQELRNIKLIRPPKPVKEEPQKPDKSSGVDMENMLQSLQSVVAELNKPRTILRDENGRITGVA